MSTKSSIKEINTAIYYTSANYRRSLLLCQAYRLYLLARYNKAELAAMNLLKEEKDMPAQAQLLLAAAYALSGKQNIAEDISRANPVVRNDAHSYRYCYGSWLRTQSVACLAYEAMGKRDEAGKLAFDIAKSLGQKRWYSTQSISFSLLAVGKFLGESEREELNFNLKTGASQDAKPIKTNKPIFVYKFTDGEIDAKDIQFTNKTNDVMYVRVITSGQPAVSENIAFDKIIKMNVRYVDENGKNINPTSIEQGTDFEAIVTITNPSVNYLTNMALSQIFPSGWEIQNFRMSSLSDSDQKSYYEYQDIRDDRVFTFFNIGGNNSRTYHVKLNASYTGEFYLPDIFCEAMYDHNVQSRIAGQKVTVTPSI